MPDLITLTCPSCGARLKVTDQIHLLHCRNCGNEHMVVRNAESIYLAPLAQDVRGIRVGVDKTAAELAVTRLRQEISDLEREMHSTQAITNNQWIKPGLWERLFAAFTIICLVFMFVALVTANFAVGGWSLVFFLFFFIAYLIASERRHARADNAKKFHLGRMNDDLQLKREQYKKNRQIAES